MEYDTIFKLDNEDTALSTKHNIHTILYTTTHESPVKRLFHTWLLY